MACYVLLHPFYIQQTDPLYKYENLKRKFLPIVTPSLFTVSDCSVICLLTGVLNTNWRELVTFRSHNHTKPILVWAWHNYFCHIFLCLYWNLALLKCIALSRDLSAPPCQQITFNFFATPFLCTPNIRAMLRFKHKMSS